MHSLALTTRLSPQHLLLLAASLGLAGWGLMLWLYLQAPYLGLTLVPIDSAVGIKTVAAGHPNHARVADGQMILALESTTGGGLIRLQSTDLVDEPDTLVDRDGVREFRNRQQSLAGILSGQTVLATIDGKLTRLAVTRRGLADVPAAYWLQSLAGWLCLVIGTAVLAFQQSATRATRYFFTAGVAIYIAAVGGAVYATRELVLPPAIFEFTLLLNHIGTVLIVACLMGLIWHYPYPLARRRLLAGVFAAAVLALIADQTDIAGIGAWLLYLYCSLGFFLGAVLAVFQWRRTRDDPVNRAAMRWFLLAMVIGVVTPSTLTVVPALFGGGLAVTHELVFFSLLVMYMGVALGITRYRLFDLEMWWFRAWGWFLGGVSILVVDVLLIGLFHLDSATALTVAVAAVGWGYFPVRQWLLQRILRSDTQPLERAMDELVDALSRTDDADAIQARWPDILRGTFATLTIRECRPGPDQIRIGQHGTTMQLPALSGSLDTTTPGFELAYPRSGSRLFNREDLRLAELLLGLMRRATAELRAREAGAEAERERIRRDMHDDLGGQLLDMAQALPDEAGRAMARDAGGRLRRILSTMDRHAQGLADVLDVLAEECRTRLSAAGMTLTWQVTWPTGDKRPQDGGVVLSARQHANLGSIVREATTNIMRHSGAKSVRFDHALQMTADGHGRLSMRISDDGRGMPTIPLSSGGTGLPGMRARAEEMGGRLTVESAGPGGVSLRLEVPISAVYQPAPGDRPRVPPAPDC